MAPDYIDGEATGELFIDGWSYICYSQPVVFFTAYIPISVEARTLKPLSLHSKW